MYNDSYKGKKASRSYIWRYSPKHKLHYDMQAADLSPASFNRIYATAMEYLGQFPEAPLITIYPESVKLWEKKDA